MRKEDLSPTTKLLVAALVFSMIVVGWRLTLLYRDRTATLPDDARAQGNCAIWFVGSSSIFRWTSLDRDMAPWIVNNRGINSATYQQILPRFKHVEGTAPPTAIVLYAGENDIAAGVPVRDVLHSLADFLVLRDRMMAHVPVLVLSMKPSPGRRASFPNQQLFNDAARHLLPRMRNATYVDTTTPLLKDGKLGDNYQPDGVHMNPSGYRIWAKIVRDELAAVVPAEKRRQCGA